MAKTRFYTSAGVETSPEIAADYAAAPGFDRVKVGTLGVYATQTIRTHFYPYSELDRAFIRIYEGTARLCCGSLGYNYTSLVLEKGDKQLAEIYTENESALRAALPLIREKLQNTNA